MVRDKLSREDYFTQYGNYCRACSAGNTKFKKRPDPPPYQGVIISESHYKILARLVKKELDDHEREKQLKIRQDKALKKTFHEETNN